MDKARIKDFAIWAREKLIEDITYKAGILGIAEDGIQEALPQSTTDLKFYDIGTKNYVEVKGKDIKQREALVKAIRDKEKDSESYKDAFDFIVEEVAYTWFNRLVAIRFMEVNDYLPSGVRVLSSEKSAKLEPDFVTNPFETDLEFTDEEVDKVLDLKDNNQLDELFRNLFIKQCNKLNEILPELFEKTEDYTELLLTISFTDKEGIVYHLTHDIDEEDFNVESNGQVEIIGWMYQYYNSVPKERVFSNLRKNKKIQKNDIPAATQIFTPDWIVRYMVENSLGRMCMNICNLPGPLENWKYFLKEPEQEEYLQTSNTHEFDKLNLDEVRIIDPCMGSGHILTYVFDLMMQFYRLQGYIVQDAVEKIIEKNIYGIDIDKRASQLAYFSIMMKARQYDRRFFVRNIKPNLYCIKESNDISIETSTYLIGNDNLLKKEIEKVFSEMKDAREYGSLINIEKQNWNNIYNRIKDLNKNINLYNDEINNKILPIIKLAEVLSNKYHVVITNPPYMGNGGMNDKLSSYLKNNFQDSKLDMFSAFIEKCNDLTLKSGYTSLITMESWMFLSSYENLRKKIINNQTIINMVHMPYLGIGKTSLGINFGTAAVVMKNIYVPNYKAQYEYTVYYDCDENGVPIIFPTINDRYKISKQKTYEKIPGLPIAYWASNKIIKCFQNDKIENHLIFKQGMATSDNNRFLRFWHEVNFNKIGFDKSNLSEASESKLKWFPYNKGGAYRKWYGNNELVVNWENDGYEMKQFTSKLPQGMNVRLKSREYYFKEGLTWSTLTSGDLSVRYSPRGYIFDIKGSKGFAIDESELKYSMGLLNSVFTKDLLEILAPTLDFNLVSIKQIPFLVGDKNTIVDIVNENISISKSDWDSFENSWDFKNNDLVKIGKTKFRLEDGNDDETTLINNACPIDKAYRIVKDKFEKRFKLLKSNEERINQVFLHLYDLNDELKSELKDNKISVFRIYDSKLDIDDSMINSKYALTKQDVIKDFMSYAVGCILGRYSLDIEGLAYAGGEWDESKYVSFIPDADNCIPITDEEYFEDDIVGRFVEFVRVVYGEDTLEDNLSFIADALGNKGKTNREVIRNYFLNDFIKDHNKKYQKRPIYWMFDSGKQNGFKALVYMHRWNADTVGNVRVEYLHKMQHIYEREIERMQEIIDNSHDNKEINKAEKKKQKLQKQLKETKDYDAKIAHIALSRIDINLDDGVKVNYDKVQIGQDGKNMNILPKIK